MGWGHTGTYPYNIVMFLSEGIVSYCCPEKSNSLGQFGASVFTTYELCPDSTGLKLELRKLLFLDSVAKPKKHSKNLISFKPELIFYPVFPHRNTKLKKKIFWVKQNRFKNIF